MFVSANSAAAEAIVNESVKQEEQRLHPMFRRTSSSSLSGVSSRSRSASVLEEKKSKGSAPRTKRGAQPKGVGKTIEEAVEVDDSDDEKPIVKTEAANGSADVAAENGELGENTARYIL